MNEPHPLLSGMHNHTLFCDGQDDVETMCRAAYEKKLCAIGFSAHAPVEKQLGQKTDWHLSEERLGEYMSEVSAAKNRWRGKIAVYLGLEVDYIKGLRSPMDNDIKTLNLDYIIGSVHYVIPANGADLFTVDAPLEEFTKGFTEGFGMNGEALMHSYYDAVSEMTAMGGFDILGHADIIKKNCQDMNYWTEESELCRQREIARAAATAGVVAEVNTGGLNRKKIRDLYPSYSFLRYFRELDVPVLITADAHNAGDINGSYDYAIKTLICAGISEHVIFFGKSNTKTLWKKEKLHY